VPADTIDAVKPLRIGVLALQGNFREHVAVLRRLGAEPVEVRKPDELAGLDGLVIPGGESTTFMRLMRLYGLDEAVRAFDGPVFGTCAGMIVLDRNHLGLVDLSVRRNAFGRQAASFETDLAVEGEETPMRAVFIRAPWVERVGPDVEVLSTVRSGPAAGRIVAVRHDRLLATSFHPEMTGDARLHGYFAELVRTL
jgi:pyridoxal 5'-phosphate synthase pdxT subunit